jgi:hypothetical protein
VQRRAAEGGGKASRSGGPARGPKKHAARRCPEARNPSVRSLEARRRGPPSAAGGVARSLNAGRRGAEGDG